VIQARHEVEAASEADEEMAAESERNQRTQRPRPRPRMRNRPLEIHDVGEVGTSRDNERETPEPIDEEGHTVGAEAEANLIPEMEGSSSEAQERGIEVPLTVQRGADEPQEAPPRRRNPRRGKQSDTT